MTELTPDKIKTAGGKLFLWRKIYNLLCRSCQMKVFRAGANVKQIGTESVVEKMQKVIDNELCSVCKNRIDTVMKREGVD